MGNNETKDKPASSINPLAYLGRDLRELSADEIKQIVENYPTLRNTPDGYHLGQNVMALGAVRSGAKNTPALQEMLDDKDNWVFKGSKTTQE